MRFLGEEKREEGRTIGGKKKKKAPRRGGVWGGAPVLKRFPQKARRKNKNI
jgi:hypothetical protein